jgi:tetratricopeptide (TPR) repeat protein
MRRTLGIILLGALALAVPATAQGTQQKQAEQAYERGVAAQERAKQAYERGVKALDERQWEKAIQFFEEVPKAASRADGALYWKAYAAEKLARHAEALAALAELPKAFPASRWINDAKALEIEVRQASGQPVAPESAADEELKLLAINSLLTSDPERALPLLEKVLQSSNPPKLKERALFVLSQSGSPRAREILASIARGKSNPDLQMKAIQQLGLFGGKDSRQVLADIYASSTDLEAKKHILSALSLGGEGEKLVELARTEKDPSLRAAAIRNLGMMGKRWGDALTALYAENSDKAVRKAVIGALFLQSNAPALIALARKETDPELKKDAVQKLSLMHSKEATEFMMEILNK